MSVFVPFEELNYPKAKMTRPHVKLHDGTIVKYCFPNAGRWKGYNENYNRRTVTEDEIKAIKYNSWTEWIVWQKENWNKLYE